MIYLAMRLMGERGLQYSEENASIFAWCAGIKLFCSIALFAFVVYMIINDKE